MATDGSDLPAQCAVMSPCPSAHESGASRGEPSHLAKEEIRIQEAFVSLLRNPEEAPHCVQCRRFWGL